MGLEIIGAGMGRTGTHSLKLALERLGFGPCHHMADVMADPAQKALWRAAGRGKLPDWDRAYAGYRAAMDWPTAYFWRELAAHYPQARVVLSVRDAGSWYESMRQTIALTMDASNDPDSFGVSVIANGVFGGQFGERNKAIAVYEAHNTMVMDSLGPERALRFDVAEGWAPLCAFLGRPVPAEPFPRTNSTEEFRARIGRP